MKLRTILASLAAVLAGCVQVHAPDTPRTTVQGTPGQAAPARPAEPAASTAQAVPAAPAAPEAQAEPAAEPDLTPLTLGSANQARDSLILEMQQAFRQGNRARLAQLLPQAQGHALEPWAAYWELRARLDVAGNSEVQQFFTRYAGTYQEDRLRNDWLLMLGQRRDWEAFAQEYPKFRMKDDREVTCYALLVQSLQEGSNTSPAVVDEVRRLWLAQREADDGCTIAASRLIGLNFGSKRMTAADAWRKARQSIEANRPRAAAG
ncbi:MAG: lytic transglycosylase protein, partial [Ramlibacter sp.]|nr:lytic transglycosylase protein [Ramlibacter sp.]